MVDRPALLRALDEAHDLKTAGEAVIDALALMDTVLPSLWLERSGRLRCQAIRGYRQIRDGIPPGRGTIGRTFRLGVPLVVHDVAGSGDYLQAAPEIVGEVCVPIRAGDGIIGCLDAETTAPPPAGLKDELLWCAQAFADRVQRLGGAPTATPAERLAAYAARLAGMTDVRRIEGLVIEAARDITQMASALLVDRDGVGTWRVLAHAGDLAATLAQETDAAVFDLIESFVSDGTSCRTLVPRESPRRDSVGDPALGSAGIAGLMAMAVGRPAERSCLLVVVDPEPLTPAEAGSVQLLELLAAHAASCLRTADAIAELRERAASDPLTGLGHHATFHEALAAARASNTKVAVLLIDVDGFKAINDSKGHQAGDRVLREIAAVLTGTLRRGDELFRIGGDEFAALISVTSPQEAMEAGRRLWDASAQAGSVTVSIGIALPRDGEADASVLARADRALYAVKQSGRDGVEIDA
jgi:diguanylate cyclase (GGDEF)-like protein